MRLHLVTAAALMTCSSVTHAQSPGNQITESLRITTPADHTTVAPGQVITVTVTSATPDVTALAIIGEDPIGISPMANNLPAQFQIRIPQNVASRSYALTAFGVTKSGDNVESRSIEIIVVKRDLPVSMSSNISTLSFSGPGSSLPILLTGKFSDGNTMDVTRSSAITFNSSNPSAFTVDQNGIVTSHAPGQGFVYATYRFGNGTRQLAIPVYVREGALSFSAISLRFSPMPVGASSAPQRVTLTNRTRGPLTLFLRITPLFAETDDCRNRRLPPHQSCSVDVIFKPRRAGSNPGTLIISNDFDGERAIIPLQGTGS